MIRLALTLAALAGVASLALASPASGASCAPAESAFAALRDAYQEVPHAQWRDGAGNRFVLLASPAGTLTVLVIPAENSAIACVVAAGIEFRAAERRPDRPI